MILTDREIRVAIETGQITVKPPPKDEAFSSTSLDLTLDPKIRMWKENTLKGVDQIFSPGQAGYSFAAILSTFSEQKTIDDTGHILEPGRFLLAWTSEWVELPHNSRIAARVEGKSSLARIGIGVHVTAPTIHAGFEGQIQLEMFNHSPLKIRLTPGMKICQLIFEQTLGTPLKGYEGSFAKQRS